MAELRSGAAKLIDAAEQISPQEHARRRAVGRILPFCSTAGDEIDKVNVDSFSGPAASFPEGSALRRLKGLWEGYGQDIKELYAAIVNMETLVSLRGDESCARERIPGLVVLYRSVLELNPASGFFVEHGTELLDCAVMLQTEYDEEKRKKGDVADTEGHIASGHLIEHGRRLVALVDFVQLTQHFTAKVRFWLPPGQKVSEGLAVMSLWVDVDRRHERP